MNYIHILSDVLRWIISVFFRKSFIAYCRILCDFSRSFVSTFLRYFSVDILDIASSAVLSIISFSLASDAELSSCIFRRLTLNILDVIL